MKKTIKISLAGLAFDIEEDAFEQLDQYLKQLQERFRDTEGGSEILNDIEARLAELFQQAHPAARDAITLSDVDTAIGILGDPEEIGEMADDEEKTDAEKTGDRGAKRMFRDPDQRVIGGVCSGLGEYLNIDPVIIRIVFIVFTLTYGVGLLIYLLLWIAIPEAKTRSEKMEMRGELINISNIERSVQREYNQLKERYQKQRAKRTARRAAASAEPPPPRPRHHRSRDRSALGSLFYALGQIILFFLKVTGAIVGFVFVITGVALLVVLIGTLVSGSLWLFDFGWDLQGINFWEIVNLFVDDAVGIIAAVCLLVLIIVPVLALVYGGVKLLFRFRANDRAVVLSSLSAWVIALIVIAVIGMSEASQFATSTSVKETDTLKIPPSDYFYLTTSSQPDGLFNFNEHNSYHDFFVTDFHGNIRLAGIPRIMLVPGKNDRAVLEITKRAKGGTFISARNRAGEIEYAYQLSDTLLTIDPVFYLPDERKYRGQKIDLKITLPVGTRIYLDPAIRYYLYAIDNTEGRWSRQMVGETWVMTEEGLSLLPRH
ncbi:MAG: PspC domain-containing protein [Bacteroidales bacterium]|nr:PspC domain-containing protein [Bacteroidales bacterium]